MEKNKFIQLSKFNNNDAILEFIEAALIGKISLYCQSTKSSEMILVTHKNLQFIHTYFPGRVQITTKDEIWGVFRGMDQPEGTRHVRETEIIIPGDLWIKKTEAATILNTPLSSALSNITPVSESKNTPSSESNNTSTSDYEKSTMLKMILGMAKAAYGFNPGEHRNLATGSKKGSIKADLERMGFEISEDTVRKYLNEAVKKHLLDVIYED